MYVCVYVCMYVCMYVYKHTDKPCERMHACNNTHALCTYIHTYAHAGDTNACDDQVHTIACMCDDQVHTIACMCDDQVHTISSGLAILGGIHACLMYVHMYCVQLAKLRFIDASLAYVCT